MKMKILTSFGIMLGESDKCKGMLHEKSFLLSQVCKLTDSLQSLPESRVFKTNPETLSAPRDYHSGLQDGCIVKACPELLEKLVLSFVANLWGALT